MTKIRMVLVAVALLATPGIIGGANAQESAAQQGQWGESGGYMMGPWMMNPQGMMANGNMAPGWMMGWNGRGAAMCSAMGGHIEGRLAYLKAELKITDAQETLWKAYAVAARENAQSMSPTAAQ